MSGRSKHAASAGGLWYGEHLSLISVICLWHGNGSLHPHCILSPATASWLSGPAPSPARWCVLPGVAVVAALLPISGDGGQWVGGRVRHEGKQADQVQTLCWYQRPAGQNGLAAAAASLVKLSMQLCHAAKPQKGEAADGNTVHGQPHHPPGFSPAALVPPPAAAWALGATLAAAEAAPFAPPGRTPPTTPPPMPVSEDMVARAKWNSAKMRVHIALHCMHGFQVASTRQPDCKLI